MDQDLIEFVERRAADLGLRYSRFMAPKALLARVLEVEHKGLERVQASRDVAACFGQAFAGYYDQSCAVCQLQTACMARVTAQLLPEAEAEVGANGRAVAGQLGLPWMAVLLMQALRETLVEDDGDAMLDKPQLRRGNARRPAADFSIYRNPPRRPPTESAYACDLGSQAAQTGWPPPIPPSSQRLGLRLKDLYVLSSPRKKVQRLSFGSRVWKNRLKRDRNRIPELNWLPEGTALRRAFKGQRIEVTVYRDRLEYRGEPFATLYEVTAAILGVKEYRMPRIHRGKEKKMGTRRATNLSAKRLFYPCFRQIYIRARILDHMREHHAEKPCVLPTISVAKCPVCGADVANSEVSFGSLPRVTRTRKNPQN